MDNSADKILKTKTWNPVEYDTNQTVSQTFILDMCSN